MTRLTAAQRLTILRLGEAGTPPRYVAADLGVSVYDVYTIYRQARADGRPIPRFKPTPGQRRPAVKIADDIAAQLEPEAEARNLTVAELAHRLLRIVARDRLTAAILDEEE